MPQTSRRLWQKITTWENLVQASKEASRLKRHKADALRFNAALEENLFDIQNRMLHKIWRPGPFRTFVVYEPKRRVIDAPQFADRVVHHALVQHIGPPLERRFLAQSFACRVGKGTLAASLCLRAQLSAAQRQWGRVYALKADISQYFPSINHRVLLKILRRTIGDRDVHWLLDRLVLDSGFEQRGLPLGCLTSQLFANAYLDMLDHYAKESLGLKFYLRYMDDFVILHHDKVALWRIHDTIRDFLVMELHLALNRKTRIFPIGQGVDFAGYRHWTDHILPHRRNVARAKQRFMKLSNLYARGVVDLPRVRSSVASFVGYMKHCNGGKSARSALDRLVLTRDRSGK